MMDYCGRDARGPQRGVSLACIAALTLAVFPAAGQQADSYNHPAADPSHDLTTKEFFKDVGGNFVGIFNVHNLGAFAGGAAAYGLSTIPEQDLEKHFARPDMWGVWGNPGRYIGNPIILFGAGGAMFAVSRKSDDRKFRSFTYALIQGSFVSAGVVQANKFAWQRLRPSGDDHFAFPSGHATDSFMVATIAADHYGWKAAIPGYALAAYVAATRMEERKHHLTDVVAGATIGYVIGKTITRRMRAAGKSKVTWNVYPSGKGAVGTVAWQLP